MLLGLNSIKTTAKKSIAPDIILWGSKLHGGRKKSRSLSWLAAVTGRGTSRCLLAGAILLSRGPRRHDPVLMKFARFSTLCLGGYSNYTLVRGSHATGKLLLGNDCRGWENGSQSVGLYCLNFQPATFKQFLGEAAFRGVPRMQTRYKRRPLRINETRMWAPRPVPDYECRPNRQTPLRSHCTYS